MTIAATNTRITITLNKELLNTAMEKGNLEFLDTESKVITEALKLYIKEYQLGLDKIKQEA